MTRIASAALAVALGAFLTTPVQAQDKQKEAYERDLIDDSLASAGLEAVALRIANLPS